MGIELTEFQYLTPGLYTGDRIKIRINYRVECTGWTCFAGPWGTTITGLIDSQVCHGVGHNHYGNYGGHDNVEVEFSGVMPGHDLHGELIFKAGTSFPVPVFKEIARKRLTIVNLDDVPPNGNGPVVCTEGQVRCIPGTYDSEICKNARWVHHKHNDIACGYTPPDGEPPVPPVPPLPEGLTKWIWIGAAVALAIAALIVLLRRRA